MAFQTASSVSAAASSSSTGSGGGGGSALSTNSSLPFSFLITFVAIFLFFLGCGLGSRRVAYEIRRNLGLVEHSVTSHTSEAQERPVLWDVYPNVVDVSLGGGEATWAELMPLSATYIRTKPPDQPSPGHAPASPGPASPSSSSPRRTYPSSLTPAVYYSRFGRIGAPTPMLARPPPPPPAPVPIPAAPPSAPLPLSRQHTFRARLLRGALRVPLLTLLILRFRPAWILPPRTAATPPPYRPKPPVRALQVALMVAMPSPARRRLARAKALEAGFRLEERDTSPEGKRRGKKRASQDTEIEEVEGGENLGEYVIGISELPWEAGDASGPVTKAVS
ncbi:hypothetical protein OBBRIDRAFT_797772 [Obba rivulosa]|uniref:Uncharacterized protein n=1 Tax=Obba rivulosa TaxID=1052685 RepID=A0A8E2ASD8_9APHY|nr:hypothetical protein OBBRIDRAFT_797772 [Obba rivulosa]